MVLRIVMVMIIIVVRVVVVIMVIMVVIAIRTDRTNMITRQTGQKSQRGLMLMRVRCREKNTLIYKDPELQKRADKSVLFFLAGANFWEKHAKNCATMSMAHITLKYKSRFFCANFFVGKIGR